MALESSLLFGLLLFAAAAAGYFFARRTQYLKRADDGGHDQSYFRGVSYLVDEQPDKAIDVFVKLLEVDSDTLETHFALGGLFRRRGETDRAIRIHQNIIARPDLARAYKERALFALAEDYLKAGLLDRAEKLFLEVVETASFREQSLHYLVGIYEQQRDWQQAIEIRNALSGSGKNGPGHITAHYYCELAGQCLEAGDVAGARRHLRRARVLNPEGVRSAMMRADIAVNSGDFRLARKLLMRVIESRPEFTTLVLPRLAEICEKAGDKEALSGLLRKIVKRSPELTRPIAHAAILDRRIDDPVSLECLREYVRSDRILGSILEALETDSPGRLAVSGPASLRQIRLVLRRLALDGPRFGCLECGFTSRTMEWRCPGCLNWDSTLPTSNLKFVSHLGASGFIH